MHRATLLILVTACTSFGWSGCGGGMPQVGETVTEASFSTDSERVAYLQTFCPAIIPASASDIHFEYFLYLSDWYLDASFNLSESDFQAFEKGLDDLHRIDSHVYLAHVGKDIYTKITCDPENRHITLESGNGELKGEWNRLQQ